LILNYIDAGKIWWDDDIRQFFMYGDDGMLALEDIV